MTYDTPHKGSSSGRSTALGTDTNTDLILNLLSSSTAWEVGGRRGLGKRPFLYISAFAFPAGPSLRKVLLPVFFNPVHLEKRLLPGHNLVLPTILYIPLPPHTHTPSARVVLHLA